jgi:hypothetical protein
VKVLRASKQTSVRDREGRRDGGGSWEGEGRRESREVGEGGLAKGWPVSMQRSLSRPPASVKSRTDRLPLNSAPSPLRT